MNRKGLSIGSTMVLLLLAGLTPWANGQQYSAWSTPVNLGPPVDTVFPDFQAFISKDGLSLYFSRIDGHEQTDPQDIWVAKRNSTSADWGEPQKLGPAINTDAAEAHPYVTLDGHWLYFTSNRKDLGGLGRQDIYVSRRANKREDFPDDPSGGWQEPVNLGANVNSKFGEQAPFVFEDEDTGATTLYFNSDRTGNFDIYASTLQPDGTFGPAVPVPGVNTLANEQHPTLSRDGLEMYFTSDRLGSTIGEDGVPTLDIWVSTRPTTSAPWGTPENLDVINARLGGPAINSPFVDAKPILSFDGTTLYFQSEERPGNQSEIDFDIWMTTRSKLKKD